MKNLLGFKAILSALTLWAEDAKVAREEKIAVGGQAVIEGVLMRGKDLWALAVRSPEGDIIQESWQSSTRTRNYPWKIPVIRGFVTMIEMMATGFRALNRSAEIALSESNEKITKKDFFIAVVTALLAVVGLFIALPLWLSEVAARYFHLAALGRNIFEGLLRGGVFISYIAVIGCWEDIKQVFRYHGAEHKTINAFEKELELIPQVVAKESRIHPRCGTSFLLIAVIMSILIFSIIGGGGLLWRVASRVVLLPVVIGLSYEVIRLASRSGALVKLLMAPFFSLQYLTTREPSEKQLEVAIASLNTALKLNGE